MKKLIVLFFISFTAVAQTQKGALSFGTGSINYRGDFEKNKVDVSTISLTPSVGYLVLKNLEVGLGVYYRYTWGKNVMNYQDAILTPYITQYFGRKRFQPFVQVKAGPVYVNMLNLESPLQGFTWDVSAGGMYFFNKNLALGFNVGYKDRHHTSEKPFTGEYIYTAKQIYAGINFNAYLPLRKEKGS